MKKYKYKYYFKKPKSEITKDILKCLAAGVAIGIASTSPYFIVNLMKSLSIKNIYPKKRVYDVFSYLRKNGYVCVENYNHQVRVMLTADGKKMVGAMQLNDLKIKHPRKWDRKWRILSFDINEKKKIHRNAVRTKLAELGFQKLHKSVWIHAFDCQAEVEMIRDFFGLTEDDICLIIAEKIDGEKRFKESFNLKF